MNTELAPVSESSRRSGSFRSPATDSPPTGHDAASGLRLIARTGRPAAARARTTSPPTFPVAPITRIMPGTSPPLAAILAAGRPPAPASGHPPPAAPGRLGRVHGEVRLRQQLVGDDAGGGQRGADRRAGEHLLPGQLERLLDGQHE